jgi:hypothetical protein
MPTRRILKSVLQNFLGTYTSRYSDYKGYWLFGLLVDKVESIDCNLLAQVSNCSDSPEDVARDLAVERFADQLSKAALDMAVIRSANLYIRRLPEIVIAPVNGRPSNGHMIRFFASVKSDIGTTFECEKQIFVAPHNPQIEIRSTRAGNEPTSIP